MRFDPLGYCFRRKNKIRDCENADVDKQILTVQVEDDDDAGNSINLIFKDKIVITLILQFLSFRIVK